MKYKLLYLLLFFVLLINPRNVFATSIVFKEQANKAIVFINQVRGTECCDKGNFDYFKQQVDGFKKENLQATFTIRYDALTNSDFQKVLLDLDLDQFEVGAFFEITPELAKDSNVDYKGTDSDWYEAQHAYTIGYAFEDRIKIIDTYMFKFFQVFGYYPKTTTAWIMDTTSLNYLKEKYGVIVHQITREQWGTDSYTLSGGPVHYPYFASKNWAFMPTNSSDKNIKNNLLILRQTGSDPLHNYGDTTNAFTTQPNDYSIDGKKINYFKDLVNLLINQNQNSYSFALLGLENSMADRYQNEFQDQLSYISSINNIDVMTANNFANSYESKISKNLVTSVYGSDLVESTGDSTLWINTQEYRARILIIDNKIVLTDFRIFDQDLVDPYNTYKAKKLGFWVTPFIFDASRFYSDQDVKTEISSKNVKGEFLTYLRKKYLPELKLENYEFKKTKQDTITLPDSLILARKNDEDIFLKLDENEIKISYHNEKNKTSEIIFKNDSFIIQENKETELVLNSSQFINEKKNQISFYDNNKSHYSLVKNCDNKTCKYTTNSPTNDVFSELRTNFYPLFFPETKKRTPSNKLSILYAHNKHSIMEKNPVRFVFIPKDEKGFSITTNTKPIVTTTPELEKVAIHEQEQNGTTFFDLTSKNIGKYKVNFKVGSDIEMNETIYFAPNCKTDKLYCLLHPIQASWYIKSMIITKLRNF